MIRRDSRALTHRRYYIAGLLPQLLAFEACIRRGSAKAAARELQLSQTTVSTLLRKLTITFGGPLTRRKRHMEPTALGERVLMLMAEMLDAFARFDSKERARQIQPDGVASEVDGPL